MVLQTSFCYGVFSLKVFAEHETATSAYLYYASTALCFLECMVVRARALGVSASLL